MSLREDWPKGAQFRVVAEGGHLWGLQPCPGFSSAFQGWRQDLHVGDVIVCLGYGPGWGSDPGYGIHFSTPQSLEQNAAYVEFRPSAGSTFDYHPADGFLEHVSEAATG